MDELDPETVFVDGRYISPDTWYDGDGKPFQPQVHYFVGGATKLYGAALYRLRPADFGEIHHVDGVSPAWPLSYDEFEPWYTKAEWLYQVHGNARRGPHRGPLLEAVPVAAGQPRAADPGDLRRSWRPGGYHPFHAPCGIMLDEADRPGASASAAPGATATRAWCTPSPTPRSSRSRPVLEPPNVTLLAGAEVARLETDPSGRHRHRRGRERDGARRSTRRDIVVVSAGAANSAKLLLRSANDAHPAGLANGSDQVGRNYMFHNCKAVVALGKERNATVFQKTLGDQRLLLRRRRPGVAARQHPDGRQVQRRGDEGRGAEADQAGPALEPGGRRRARGRLLAHHRGPAQAGQPGDRRRGRPRPSGLQGDQRRGGGRAVQGAARTILNHVGMADHHVLDKNFYMSMDVPVAGVAHQAGTCRFGPDPATSVLDVNCKAHELDNLYVVDTSFFPSIGAVNPALTAMANAIRVGEHLTARLARPRLLCRGHDVPQVADSSASTSCDTASINARWVKAWGKLPRCSPVFASISSA